MSFDNIPADLKNSPRWIVWRVEERDGKPTKVPYNSRTKKRCIGPHDEWGGTYEEAVESVLDFSGLGYVFGEGRFIGIDLDKCATDGRLESWAQEIVNALNSYTEWSPSGKGVHVLVEGKLPDGGNRRGRVEMYNRGRYFTVTGQRLEGSSPNIEQRDLNDLHTRMLAGTLETFSEKKSLVITAPEVDESASGIEFRAIWDLCKILGPDSIRIETEVRRALPWREKWETRRGKDTYLAYNILRIVEKYKASDEYKKPGVMLASEDIPVLVTRTTEEFVQDTTIKPRDPLLSINGSQFPLITTYSLNEIYAWRGTGKTNFVIGLANCFASGEKWLYFTPQRPMRVLLVEGEMPESSLQERMRAQKAGHTNFHFACVDFQPGKVIPSLFDTRGQRMIENKITEVQSEIVILDSISSLFGFETNEEANWSAINPWFVKLRNTGIALFTTHHAGKSMMQLGPRGHSKSQDPLDVSIKLNRPPDALTTQLTADLSYDKLRDAVPDARPIRVWLERPETFGGASAWKYRDREEYYRERAVGLFKEGFTSGQVANTLGISIGEVAYFKRTYDDSIRVK